MNQKLQHRPGRRGLNVILSIDDKVLGGQRNCKLIRETSTIETTNKINSDWKEYITGPRSWTLECSGLFIRDEQSFELMENAFNNGASIKVSLDDGNKKYNGIGIISKFPISATYDNAYAYNITIKGSGPLA